MKNSLVQTIDKKRKKKKEKVKWCFTTQKDSIVHIIHYELKWCCFKPLSMKQCDKIKFDWPKKKTQETKKNIHVDSDVIARAYIGHILRLGMLSCLVNVGYAAYWNNPILDSPKFS